MSCNWGRREVSRFAVCLRQNGRAGLQREAACRRTRDCTIFERLMHRRFVGVRRSGWRLEDRKAGLMTDPEQPVLGRVDQGEDMVGFEVLS